MCCSFVFDAFYASLMRLSSFVRADRVPAVHIRAHTESLFPHRVRGNLFVPMHACMHALNTVMGTSRVTDILEHSRNVPWELCP